MTKQTTLSLLFLAGSALVLPVADACPNTAGVVLGSIFGTLAAVAIVGAIVYFCCIRKKRDGRDISAPSAGKEGHANPSYVPDVEAGPTQPPCDTSQHKDMGFGGYVVCREYESKPTHDRP